MIDTEYNDYLGGPTAPPEHLVCSECAQLLARTNAILERLEAELTRPTWSAPPTPPRPDHEIALDWLAALCGGHEAVTALDAAPLVEDALDLPVVEDPVGRTQLEAVAALLDEVAADFPAEVGFALRRALLRLWEIDPLVIDPPTRPAQVAAGIVWTVLGANGLAGPGGLITATALKERLGLTKMPTAYGKQLAAALRGFWPWQTQLPWGMRDLPDLEPLGYPDLLVSSVRRRLVRLRDQACLQRDGGTPR
ncbi:hypothetical protein J2S40_003847 [Nocardioides luteus]|uniref:Uncharacterized protein n=1 Tax=Nocardioides luteus TaxID=1844 RepID=A0ABQ5SXX8_9ACTN|nr:hypothetical protein [Nocardioides luteus]MDR7312789.1 hypothetical protein [Nocardioides luteus]GGR47542.1 hypothetical protein GCM10010197_11780 [Nocardioides luteus]GLJ69042.1 hypothetical protein GCM10017579_30780 [Nocardioides luteus]